MVINTWGLPWWLSGKESACQCRRWRCGPWVRKIPWRKKRLFTPAFMPGKSYGQRSLTGYGPWGCKELDTTEQLSTMIAYGEWCQIHDLQRKRFNFRTRDQAWSLKSFCVAELTMKRDRECSWHRHLKGEWRVPHSLVWHDSMHTPQLTILSTEFMLSCFVV